MPDQDPPVLTSVAASRASSTAGGLIVRVEGEEDLGHLAGLDRDRVAWVEVPLDLAHRSELDDFSVDVLLADPRAEAGHLYHLARLREPARPRVTIPGLPGLSHAAAVAMALHFPLRLLPVQPGPDQVRELEEVLERYLHDPHSTEVVEPFHSALAVLLHGAGPTLWEALEKDPASFRREPPEPGLEEAVPLEECASCPLGAWCGGWFKWPDPEYDCSGVVRLFTGLEGSAARMRADLEEARELIP